jgi:hypothetical protein
MSSISSNAPSGVYTPSTPPTLLSPSLRPSIQVTPPPTTFRSTPSSLCSTTTPPPVHLHPTELTSAPTSHTSTVTTVSANEDHPPHHDLRLYTTPRRHIYTYEEDMFASRPHRVVGLIQRPPTTLAIGMRVQLGSVRGTLTKIYGVQRERVLFVLQPDESDRAYVVLRVHPRYAKLSRYWRMRLRIYPWTHWCH